MILAGDIGSTSTRLAAFEAAPSGVRAIAERVYASGKHRGIGEIVGQFVAKGRMQPLLERIPVQVILSPNVGLFGATRYAAMRSGILI